MHHYLFSELSEFQRSTVVLSARPLQPKRVLGIQNKFLMRHVLELHDAEHFDGIPQCSAGFRLGTFFNSVEVEVPVWRLEIWVAEFRHAAFGDLSLGPWVPQLSKTNIFQANSEK